MHEDVRIRLVGKVPLDSFVSAVGVTDEDLKPLLDHCGAIRQALTPGGSIIVADLNVAEHDKADPLTASRARCPNAYRRSP